MNEENMNNVEEQVDLSALGAFSGDKKLSAKAQKAELPRIPTIRVADMPLNERVCGFVVNADDRIPSDSEFAQEDADGNTYSDRLVLQSTSGKQFAIWHTNWTRNQSMSLIEGDYVELEYKGQAEKPLKKGQKPPHIVEFYITDAEGRKVDILARRKAAEAGGRGGMKARAN